MAHTPKVHLAWLAEALETYFPGAVVLERWLKFADSLDFLEPQNAFRELNENLKYKTFLEGEELRPADLYVFSRVTLCPAWKRVMHHRNRPPYLARWAGHISTLVQSRGSTEHSGHSDLRLHAAIEASDLDLARRLLRIVNLNERNEATRGMQAIHVAAKNGNREAVQLLLDAGVSLEALDLEGMTPIFYAAHGGHLDFLRFLVAAGANPSHLEGQGRTALYWAANVGQTEVLRLLLELGCDPNIKTRLGRTALSKAAWSAQVEVVRVLCEFPSVKLDDRDSRGRTPLHNAVWGESGGRTGKKIAFGNTSDSPECAEILIRHMKARGISIDIPDVEGNTPLCIAASTNAPRSVQLLLDEGANPLSRNRFNNVPLHEAVRRGHIEPARILIQSGVDPNVSGFNGNTPLHTTIYFNQEAACRFLLPQVVVPASALEYCVECKRASMLEQIFQYYSGELPDSLLLRAVQAQDSALFDVVFSRWTRPIHTHMLEQAAKLSTPADFAKLLAKAEEVKQEVVLAAAYNEDISNLNSVLGRVHVTAETFLKLTQVAPEPACLRALKSNSELWSTLDPETGESPLHRACFRGFNLLTDRLLRASGPNCCSYIAQTDHSDLTAHTLAVINKHLSIAAYLEDLYQQGAQKPLETRIIQLSYVDLPDTVPENPIPAEEYPTSYIRLQLEWRPAAETPVLFLDKEEQIAELEVRSASWQAVGMDLEYFSFDAHRGVIALLQLSDGMTDYILDPLRCPAAVGRFARNLMRRKDCVKVLHGADSDLVWMQLDYLAYAVNIFDTGRAHRTLAQEVDLPSLGKLISIYLDVNLDKAFQIADWRIRPLPPPMLKYAREDAHYLLQLYTVLVSRMDEQQLAHTASLCTKLCRKTPSGRHQRVKAGLVSESPS